LNTPQIIAVSIIIAMMVAFVWGRLRYDVVAAVGLIAAVVTGIVPAKDAFSGFSDDIVIIVASALVVSAAIARSGVMERGLAMASPLLRTTSLQVLVLAGAVGILSAFIKNIGALAMLIPVAFQIAKRNGTSVSVYLMPMAFAALLGGIVTLVGTSPNIIVARLRQELVGQPFGMFDFAPVGIGLAVAGIAFLAVGWRLIPRDRTGATTLGEAINIKDYTTEALVTEHSNLAGGSLADLKSLSPGGVTVAGIVRGGARISVPLPDAKLAEGDLVLLRGDPEALEQLVSAAKLELAAGRPIEILADPSIEAGSIEAVIGPNSLLIGTSARRASLYDRYGINLVAVSRARERFTERLRDIDLREGDVVVLNGDPTVMPQRMGDLGLLPLVERTLMLGSRRKGWIAVTILIATIAVLALGVMPVPMTFFAAAVALVLFRALPLRDAYEAIEWPILVMLAALIPVSEALRTTGTTDLISTFLSGVAQSLPAWGAVGLIMVVAMAVTPFLNNAATVLVMAPIAAGFASGLGYKPDAFLMAVAIGAACDFLTPIGHQCNTLVLGPGGYKFGDYARLGLPLSLLVVVLGIPLILLVWPLR
jgi:di/tricarboxylate transporter